MAERWKRGPENGNWRGGRVVEPRGYVLIRVGKDHPLADCRGYAYEHRLIAQDAAGRPLTTSEEVHHDNEVKGDNTPQNLEVCATKGEHRARHRCPTSSLRLPHEANPMVECACGCEASFPRYDSSNRPRRFVSGHNMGPTRG